MTGLIVYKYEAFQKCHWWNLDSKIRFKFPNLEVNDSLVSSLQDSVKHGIISYYLFLNAP